MSTPDESSLHDLAAAYALGALSTEETRAFEAYLATSAEARREVAELRETAALLAVAGPEARPGPELRRRVLDAVAATKVAVLPRPSVAAAGAGRPVLAWLAAAAAIVVAVALGLRVRAATTALAARDSTIAEQQRSLSEQQQQLLKDEATLAALLAPGVQLVQLTKEGDPDPRIQLYWDRVHNTAVLHASKLKPVPPGRTYQLWFIRDGKPVPSVTFEVAPAGDALLREVTVPTGGEVSAAAITQEPAGGSQQPTTPILLVGTVRPKA
ncbi:MAG TPA: anti-sigma factor [Gemmatimonadales bacterium]|nr:anti-sigma factor [Gemmatimonadales bacterium]